MGHFDSKMRIEAHIRRLPIKATIIRPVAFIDMLVMPGFGLARGALQLFHALPNNPSSFWLWRTSASLSNRYLQTRTASAAGPLRSPVIQ